MLPDVKPVSSLHIMVGKNWRRDARSSCRKRTRRIPSFAAETHSQLLFNELHYLCCQHSSSVGIRLNISKLGSWPKSLINLVPAMCVLRSCVFEEHIAHFEVNILRLFKFGRYLVLVRTVWFFFVAVHHQLYVAILLEHDNLSLCTSV